MDSGNHTNEFLAILGHEMRNSLSALDYALQIWSQQDPEVMDDLRHIMERQVRQLTRLSDDLLDTARIARGELRLHCECIVLQEVIEEACEEVRPIIDSRGHTLSVNLPDSPITVCGDSARLIQAFANLLQNAAKFTDRNGCLGITVELQSTRVAVRVSDNGCGIEQRALATVFDSGSIVNVPQVSVNDGLGIGLKLVKAIVDSHGGSVFARSDGIAYGSEFTVLLQLWDRATHADKGPPLPTNNTIQMLSSRQSPAYRIVVADDDREQGELLAELLRQIGQSVTVATNGVEAIEQILQRRPQVVFLELTIDEQTGYAVACELRKRAELDGLMLVALSGSGNEQDKGRALDAGCDMFLAKPVSLLDLANVLDQVSSDGRVCI